MLLNDKIFNLEKKDYVIPSLFLGESMGFLDSINKHYPNLFDLYKKMKSQDWDENEFNFTSCNVEFKTCPKNIYDMMLLTLAWKWEADSIASRSVFAITAPFISSNELNCLWQRISENECLHALTYSEIVRNSFDNSAEILDYLSTLNNVFDRSYIVTEIFAYTFDIGHKLSLGLIPKDQTAYDAIFMFVVTLYCLERIQFMASFAVTFAIADSGIFVPIGKAVQKICKDEFDIHVKACKTILNYELVTERGLMTFNRMKPKISELLTSIIESEFKWINYLFSDGRELVGMDAELLKKWVLFNAADVYNFFGIQSSIELPNKNPLGFIEEWINIDKIQGSPQEEKTAAYLVGAIINDDEGKIYSTEF